MINYQNLVPYLRKTPPAKTDWCRLGYYITFVVLTLPVGYRGNSKIGNLLAVLLFSILIFKSAYRGAFIYYFLPR